MSFQKIIAFFPGGKLIPSSFIVFSSKSYTTSQWWVENPQNFHDGFGILSTFNSQSRPDFREDFLEILRTGTELIPSQPPAKWPFPQVAVWNWPFVIRDGWISDIYRNKIRGVKMEVENTHLPETVFSTIWLWEESQKHTIKKLIWCLQWSTHENFHLLTPTHSFRTFGSSKNSLIILAKASLFVFGQLWNFEGAHLFCCSELFSCQLVLFCWPTYFRFFLAATFAP